MARAWIALGANLGQPRRQLLAALDALAAMPQTHVEACSRLYQTPPWGLVEQPPFVNAVARLRTRLEPRELLQALLTIERDAGRQRTQRWGPRLLDLDLLLYDERIQHDADLTLPHPRIAERAFVLLPLADIDADLQIPGHGRVADLLARVDTSGCRPLETDSPA